MLLLLVSGLSRAQPSDAGTTTDVPQVLSPARALVDATLASEFFEETLGGGRHFRFGTDRGPVHVFVPEGYRAAQAGIVVYVHGYTQNVDQVWEEHRLGWQFAGSGLNALFVVPEVPSARADDVFWKDLEALLTTVRRRTHLRWPKGPIVAAGHSGAYRTLSTWLSDPQLSQVLLIDALYANEPEFGRWVKASQADRQLVLVSIETVERTAGFLRKFRRAALREEIPEGGRSWTRRERLAMVVALQTSRYDHFTLITSGEVLPVLLQLSPLERVAESR